MMGKRKPISLSLDFHKSKKARRKQPVLGLDGAEVSKTENEKDFVSAISDNTLDGSAKEAQLPVIAVPLNPWQKKKEDNAVIIDNEKKKKNLDDIAAEALIKEAIAGKDGKPVDLASPNMTLTISLPETAGKDAGKTILQANQMPGLNDIANEDDRFKYDISMRADDVNEKSSCYTTMPISAFGEAALRGMGWKGKIDKDDKTDVNEPRHHRLGLGATPKPPSPKSKKKRRRKPGEKPSRQDKLQADWERQAAEKLAKQKLGVEDKVWLRTARYATQEGCVLGFRDGGDKVEVRLEGSGETVVVPRSDAVLLSQSGGGEEDDAKDEKRKKERRGDEKEPAAKMQYGLVAKTWLIRDIRVRVITKGENYRRKGTVCDTNKVRGVQEAVVRLDDGGGSVKHLREEDLETVVPSKGGVVMIVRGKHRKRKAKLIEKDQDRAEARVKIEDYGKVYISLDDIAEWAGKR